MNTDLLPAWMLANLGDREPGPAVRRVLAALVREPRAMSYASTALAADLAEVNIATVVRAAQQLGFSGWPALRAAVRARFLEGLTASDTLLEHRQLGEGVDPASVVRRDIANLNDLVSTLDPQRVAQAAQRLAGGGTSVVLASGSHAGPGLILAHMLSTLGHDIRLLSGGDTATLNSVLRLGVADNLVVVDTWRTTRLIRSAMAIAHDGGATVIRITDVADGGPTQRYLPLVVPSEGSGMFQSLTCAVSAAQAVVAAVVELDEEAARAAASRVERQWEASGLFGERSFMQ